MYDVTIYLRNISGQRLSTEGVDNIIFKDDGRTTPRSMHEFNLILLEVK
jgi:hypothetical protein